MDSPLLKIDVAILGGGVAGLWALNLLHARGYSAVLFEEGDLGGAQTLGSQGMIHGGVKYALGGVPTAASESIASMPAVWRECLAGRGAVDLRRCRLLSEHCYLWSGSAGGRLNSFLASKLLQGRVVALPTEDCPAALRHPDFRGRVYRLPDPVLDVSSLLAALAEPNAQSIFRIDWRNAALRRRGRAACLSLPGATIDPQCLLLTAGSSNESLVASLGARGPAMQRRPLQQVLVKHEYEPPLFGHCVGSKPSPRLTISSHRAGDGRPVWYLGGDLATAGASEEPERLIRRARDELATVLPWVDLGNCEWRTLKLDRAEPRQAGARRPGGAFLGAVDGLDNALVGWPGKLTLAPRLGDALLDALRQRGILPRHEPDLSGLQALPRPRLASPCWDTLFR
jgi:glycine/D-amino acid oxidase-like deaminating enzyme